MRIIWIWVLLIGCGAGRTESARPMDVGDITAAAAQRFVDAINAQDLAAVQASLHAPLSYAGLLFTDAACTQQFPVAATVEADRIAAFAACLAKLPLRTSRRRDPLFGVAILEYTPGIEVAARFGFADGKAAIRWVGYAGARDGRDPLPSLTPTALAALRTDASDSRLSAAHTEALDAELARRNGKATYAWLKVCLDGTGTTTSIHPVEASSPRAAEAFVEVIRTWTFKPFLQDGQAVPACSLVLLEHPGDTARAVELLPYPLPAADVAPRVSADDLVLLEGERKIVPDDADKMAIQQRGNPSLVGAYWLCIDEAGSVMSVNAIEPTGIPGYDAKIASTIRTWKYRPFVANEAPHKVCAAVTFIYRQS